MRRDPSTIQLPGALASYRDERPGKQDRRRRDVDGSQTELRIVSTLVRLGLTDDEILEYFRLHELPRFMEEGQSETWLGSLIRTARTSEIDFALSRQETSTEDDTQQQRVVEIQHTPSEARTYASVQLPFLVLQERARRENDEEHVLLTQWYAEIIEVSKSLPKKPVGLSTARVLAQRLREAGYAETERLPGNRQRVRLTDKGRYAATPVRGKWCRFIPLTTSESRGSVALIEPPAVVEQPATTSQVRMRRPTSPEQKQRNRTVLERRHQRVNDLFRISFRGNKVRFMQLLTPPAEWLKGPVWAQLITGADEDGLPIYSWIAAEDGDDPVRAIMPSDWEPFEKRFALAAEFEQHGAELALATYPAPSGTVLPAIGLIAESPRNFSFFDPLRASEWGGSILQVKGTGAMPRRRFTFTPIADAVDLRFSFDLEAALLGSMHEQRHREQLSALPAGWFHMPRQRKMLVSRLLGLTVPDVQSDFTRFLGAWAREEASRVNGT
jgi:hypothetical protein